MIKVTLTNNIVSFEQLGPEDLLFSEASKLHFSYGATKLYIGGGTVFLFKIACAPSEDSDQPVQKRRLIRIFAVHS